MISYYIVVTVNYIINENRHQRGDRAETGSRGRRKATAFPRIDNIIYGYNIVYNDRLYNDYPSYDIYNVISARRETERRSPPAGMLRDLPRTGSTSTLSSRDSRSCGSLPRELAIP